MSRDNREIKVKRITDYRQLVEAVQDLEVVILVEGAAYLKAEKIIRERNIRNLVVACLVLYRPVLLTPLELIMLLGNYVSVADVNDVLKSRIKRYKLKINSKWSRIELYLNEGNRRFNGRYDRLII